MVTKRLQDLRHEWLGLGAQMALWMLISLRGQFLVIVLPPAMEQPVVADRGGVCRADDLPG